MKHRFVGTVLRTAKNPLGGCLVHSSKRVSIDRAKSAEEGLG